ncbi:MAG: Ubiquinone biosynthesis protein coq9, mitochondrial [Thelocarpon impressellum]|nr:MAG: Ubiquinone biosynthesis protein coq9, mitochondrial [Thelocarpon impressellum]
MSSGRRRYGASIKGQKISRRPLTPPRTRPYHSPSHPPAPPFPPAEDAILSASLLHVPAHGFSPAALARGAADAGYLPASVNLFPRGAFELVNYHLVTQRLALQDRVQFGDERAKLGVGGKVRLLARERLLANGPTIHRWQEALALMAQPSNARTSIAELARLADETWFLAGDTSVDSSWYTKRASLSAIYSSTEVFMTQDRSPHFVETQRFLDRRLEDARAVGEGLASVGEWVGFTGHAFTNVLRSKGVRI